MPDAPMTREQIGRMIDVSKERICQTEQNAPCKLRNVLDLVYGASRRAVDRSDSILAEYSLNTR